MAARRAAAVADRDGGHALVPAPCPRPAKTPGWPVIMRSSTRDDAVLDATPSQALEQGQVGVLAEREHDGVGVELLVFAGRLGACPSVVERHALDPQPGAAVDLARLGRDGLGGRDRRQPLEGDALLLGLGAPRVWAGMRSRVRR